MPFFDIFLLVFTRWPKAVQQNGILASQTHRTTLLYIAIQKASFSMNGIGGTSENPLELHWKPLGSPMACSN